MPATYRLIAGMARSYEFGAIAYGIESICSHIF